jgi:hypothetical protein
LAASQIAVGQEIIRDPENPAQATDPEDTEPGSRQIISDPENPRSQSDVPSEEPVVTRSDRGGGWMPASFFAAKLTSQFFVDTGYENAIEDVFMWDNRLDLRARLDVSPDWSGSWKGGWHRYWERATPWSRSIVNEHYQGTLEPTLRDAYPSGHFDTVYLTLGNRPQWAQGR